MRGIPKQAFTEWENQADRAQRAAVVRWHAWVVARDSDGPAIRQMRRKRENPGPVRTRWRDDELHVLTEFEG